MLHLSCHGDGAQWERVSRTATARSDAGILKETLMIAVWKKQLFLSNLIVLLLLNRGISMSMDSLISDLSGKSNFISLTGVPFVLVLQERFSTNKIYNSHISAEVPLSSLPEYTISPMMAKKSFT